MSASAKQSYDETSRKSGEVLRNLGEWGRGLRDSVLGMPSSSVHGYGCAPG